MVSVEVFLMNAFPTNDNGSPNRNVLHRRFLAMVPRIERHARIYFRHLKCPVKKADCVAETIGLSWKWFVRLTRRGKDARKFVSTLASFAARAVRSGRRVCGQERAKDVLSSTAQQRHGFVVGKLPDFSTLTGNPLAEALEDNLRSPVPDQVAFRLDFPAWLTTLTQRNRRILQDMAVGERTKHLARKYGISAGRVSQLRRVFEADWRRFCAESVAPNVAGFRA